MTIPSILKSCRSRGFLAGALALLALAACGPASSADAPTPVAPASPAPQVMSGSILSRTPTVPPTATPDPPGAGDQPGVAPTPVADATPVAPPDSARTITLGHIDPDNPTRKIQQLKPLADFLAAHLTDRGIGAGKVIIARDEEELAALLREGRVDFYLDGPAPSLKVCEMAGCRFILRQWKRGEPSFKGVLVTHQSTGITSVEELLGKVIALQKARSTVGYILPAATLTREGFQLTEVDSPEATVPPGEIGFITVEGERSVIELLTTGRVSAGAMSDFNYLELPPELQEQVTIFHRTITGPKQLVSARADLEPELVQAVIDLMLDLHQRDDGLAVLDALRDTQQFDALPPGAEEELAELRRLIALVPVPREASSAAGATGGGRGDGGGRGTGGGRGSGGGR